MEHLENITNSKMLDLMPFKKPFKLGFKKLCKNFIARFSELLERPGSPVFFRESVALTSGRPAAP